MNIKHKVPFIFEIRNATSEDVDNILKLDNEVWTDFPASRDMIESRIRVFPEGNFVAINKNEVIGYLSVQLINYDLMTHPPFSWNEITDNGTVRSSHNSAGKFIYGVAMTVSNKFQNLGIATRLLFAGWSTGVKFNIKGCLLGCRMPGYGAVQQQYRPEEYLMLRRQDGKLADPELRLYESDGFRIICLLPEYEDDPLSGNYGVLVYQDNPFYNKGTSLFRKIMAIILARWGHKIVGV